MGFFVALVGAEAVVDEFEVVAVVEHTDLVEYSLAVAHNCQHSAAHKDSHFARDKDFRVAQDKDLQQPALALLSVPSADRLTSSFPL